MTKEPESAKTSPGAGAGDAAPTQAIPRISKSEPTTDKGRPRPAPAANSAAPKGASPKGTAPKGAAPQGTAPKGAAPQATAPEKKRTVEPVGGPPGRPITAAEYARTTKPTAATTAVIPAVKDAAPSKPRPASSPAAPANTGRQASLRLKHIEPWSVTRLTFTVSVALMIVAVVAAAIFWIVLNVIGVWGQINDAFTSVLSDDNSSFNVKDYFGFGRFVGLTLVLSAINVVLMTMFATIGAHIYNLAAQLMGGVEVTFSEEK